MFDTEKACALAAQGQTIRQIAAALSTSYDTIRRERLTNGLFDAKFTRARIDGLELLADDLVTMDEDVEDVQRAKLRSENVRWLLSRRLPHQYGDKIAIDLTGQIDLAAALKDANNRLQRIDTPQLAAPVFAPALAGAFPIAALPLFD